MAEDESGIRECTPIADEDGVATEAAPQLAHAPPNSIVGAVPPSAPAEASGLHDLTGNVSEWTNDFYTLLPPGPADVFVDPLGPDTGSTHVVKGASWRAGTRTWLRAAYRDGQSGGRDDLGFRVGRYLYAGDLADE